MGEGVMAQKTETFYICDSCGKKMAAPIITITSGESPSEVAIYPYQGPVVLLLDGGDFCSVKCLFQHIEGFLRPQTVSAQ
jgi:hypothetical protein